ncbi:DUF4292 domain-containing protein [Terrimonas pollutisoli]|uniref:DUF4292 domain-containing protein n=1 Tax=Terrimonas pollutisoli TaxID=3034147 RepID=UPI0023EC2344|nr:DUF4292 domain-containing protein [Terrimonas sp. H1YJ31]
MIRTTLIVIVVGCLMASCRSTRKIQTAIAKKDSVTIVPVTNKSGEDSAAIIKETTAKMNAGLIDFTTFSSKVKVDYEGSDGKKYDVTANLRMYKDSVIWISITGALGIEGIRAYITPDSVKILNKMDKAYSARSVAYLQDVVALPLDLHSLQGILIGNPVFVDSTIISYSKNGDDISLLTIGEWFKNLLTLNAERRIENSKLDDIDKNRSRTCNLSYTDYENKKGVNFSTKRRITVAEKSKLDIKLDFKSYEFNETLSFPFSIPKNYKKD